ncbi:MAG: transcription initiation protein [Nitrospinae bacterium]|nr:transcription initiation protein [Nitrospinota bacterium]
MNEFALLFRMDITTKEARPSPEQMEAYLTQWHDWTDNIAAQNKLASGNHFSVDGKVIKKDNMVTEGPYTANKMSVAGYIIIKAKDFDEAVNMAKACPILQGEGTSVEVRKIVAM